MILGAVEHLVPSGVVAPFGPPTLFESGLAIANLSDQPASVQIRLRAARPPGSLAPEILLLTGLELGPHQHQAWFLSELFPEIEELVFKEQQSLRQISRS
jgi:hypothetical protein